MNLANKLTVGRLVIAAIFFATLEATGPEYALASLGTLPERRVLLLNIAFVLFFIAGVTDFLDGWVARRYEMTSDFGRVADPFCDKVMICGSFVYLSTLPIAIDSTEVYVPPWVTVLIVGREFLVTGLRGFLEARGQACGAMVSGKIKMVLQCLAIGSALLTMANFHETTWAPSLTRLLVWLCLAATLLSGWTYVNVTRRLLASEGS